MIARIWHGAVPVSKGSEYLILCGGLRFPSIWRRKEIEARGVCTAPKEMQSISRC